MPHAKVAACYRQIHDEQRTPDVTLLAEGRQIHAHRAVLGAFSGRFLEELEKDGRDKACLQTKESYPVMRALVRFMYFGGVDQELNSFEALDLMQAANVWGVSCLAESDVVELVVPRLSVETCVPVLLHPEVSNRPRMARGVCFFIGEHLQDVGRSRDAIDQLMAADMKYNALVLKKACWCCKSVQEFDAVLRYALRVARLENPTEVLNASKVWPWAALDLEAHSTFLDPGKVSPDVITKYKSLTPDQVFQTLDADGCGLVSKAEFRQMRVSLPEIVGDKEWVIPRVKEASQSQNCWRVIYGEIYEWQVRLDAGAGGQLRIVYESATAHPKIEVGACLMKFPAATFAWQASLNGKDLPMEPSVFIAFAECVDLHWSTSLGISTEDLKPDDELLLRVKIIENPILGLTLYHLYCSMDTDSQAEEILNQLPHIEYRCISSYIIFRKTASRLGSRMHSPRDHQSQVGA